MEFIGTRRPGAANLTLTRCCLKFPRFLADVYAGFESDMAVKRNN